MDHATKALVLFFAEAHQAGVDLGEVRQAVDDAWTRLEREARDLYVCRGFVGALAEAYRRVRRGREMDTEELSRVWTVITGGKLTSGQLRALRASDRAIREAGGPVELATRRVARLLQLTPRRVQQIRRGKRPQVVSWPLGELPPAGRAALQTWIDDLLKR